jgi:undecaprenyl-diphosphatase
VIDRAPRLRNDPWTWVGITCAIAFLILAVVVNEEGAVGFDDPVIVFVKGLPISTDVWTALTAVGGTILIPLGIVIVVALLALRRVRTAVTCGIALAGAALATQVIKVSIGRLRPPEGAAVPAPGFSFPSGHTLNSTVTYGLIALLVWRSDLPAWLRRIVAIALGVLVFVIGLSRIALGVHYPSDVVGGWLGGLAVMAAVALSTRGQPTRRTT